jgi:hypothetical protein
MKKVLAIIPLVAASAAQAHDSLVPHTHPHGISMLPDIGTFGIAALVLAIAVIVYAQVKGR